MGSRLLTTHAQARSQLLSCCCTLRCVQESLLSARVRMCFMLQGQIQYMATANGGYFREDISLFWVCHVLIHASETQLVNKTPFLYERTHGTCLLSVTSSGHRLTCRGVPSGLWIRGDGAWPAAPMEKYLPLPGQHLSGTAYLWHHCFYFSGYSKQKIWLMAFFVSKHC